MIFGLPDSTLSFNTGSVFDVTLTHQKEPFNDSPVGKVFCTGHGRDIGRFKYHYTSGIEPIGLNA